MKKSARYRLFDVATGEALTVARGADGVVVPAATGDSPELPLIALVPAERCATLAVDVPEMSATKMREALRWAAEDAIAGDPQAQHVVPVRRRADGRLVCAVAARADMQGWLEQLPRRPARVVPDAACLPRAEGEVTLLPLGRHVLVRAGEFEFDRIEPELLEVLLPEYLERGNGPVRPVWIGESPPQVLTEATPGHDPVIRPSGGSPLAILAAGALESPIDLAGGEFSGRDAVDTKRAAARLAWLAAAAVFLWLAGATVEYTLLERRAADLQARVEARISELFPGITTVVRPRAQVERELAALGGASRDRFVELMRRVSPVFSGADEVDVRSLRFADGVLEIELATPGLADLEALQRQLAAYELRVELGDVEVQPEGTSGRITVGGVSG
ncbi:MAG: type II secretion system protein GspL [Wenzhouxiangellaceae bacterium]|nr:type II secretion system protein GspL [Wenzhouxiangellaceae bacterium]